MNILVHTRIMAIEISGITLIMGTVAGPINAVRCHASRICIMLWGTGMNVVATTLMGWDDGGMMTGGGMGVGGGSSTHIQEKRLTPKTTIQRVGEAGGMVSIDTSPLPVSLT